MICRKTSPASLFAIGLAAGSLFWQGQALAHAHLLSATPAANSMAMPAPAELKLKFSERIELKFTTVKLSGAKKTIVKTGPARLDPNDDRLLIVPLIGPLPDGMYKVDWQALSTDGHKTKGTYSFESMR